MKRTALTFLYALSLIYASTTQASARDLETRLFPLPSALPIQILRAHRHALTLKSIDTQKLLRKKVTLTRDLSALELYNYWTDSWKDKPITPGNWNDANVRSTLTDYLLLPDSGLTNDARADVLKQKAEWEAQTPPQTFKQPSHQQTTRGPTAISQFKNWMKILEKTPEFIKNHSHWYGALKTSEAVLLTDVDAHYETYVNGENAGVINFQSKKFTADESLRFMALMFYTKLTRSPALQHGQRIMIWDQGARDVWALALESAHGDRLSALRILSLFSHDIGYNQLTSAYIEQSSASAEEKSRILHDFNLLNYRNKNEGTYFADLFRPGALKWNNGKPLNISPWLMRRFQQDSKRAEKLGLTDNPSRLVEADYYHFYAGVMLTAELAASGSTKSGLISLPVFLSELQGYAYKKIANQQYIQGDSLELYKLGCRHYRQKNCMRPKTWARDTDSELRFQQAKVLLDLNLLHVELNAEQHRLGALWAFEKLAR